MMFEPGKVVLKTGTIICLMSNTVWVIVFYLTGKKGNTCTRHESNLPITVKGVNFASYIHDHVTMVSLNKFTFIIERLVNNLTR
jgi:hypothetical protein